MTHRRALEGSFTTVYRVRYVGTVVHSKVQTRGSPPMKIPSVVGCGITIIITTSPIPLTIYRYFH